jgi:hypothetical protein
VIGKCKDNFGAGNPVKAERMNKEDAPAYILRHDGVVKQRRSEGVAFLFGFRVPSFAVKYRSTSDTPGDFLQVLRITPHVFSCMDSGGRLMCADLGSIL